MTTLLTAAPRACHASDASCYCGELASVDRPCTPVELAEAQAECDATSRVLDLILAEIDRAHGKHGRSVEDGDDNARCRILMAECMEVSKAIDAVAHAETMRDRFSRDGTTTDLEIAREHVAFTRSDLLAMVREHIGDEVVRNAELRDCDRWAALASKETL